MKPIKQPEGTYKYDFRYNGRRYRKQGIKKKSAADAEIRKILNEVSHGIDASSNVLLHEYYERWVTANKEERVTDKTLDNYKNALRLIESYFPQNKRIKDLTSIEYQEFINHYAKDHTKESVRKVHNAVKACLEHAVHDGLIYRNPAWNTKVYGKVPTQPDHEKYMEINQYKALKNDIKQYDSRSALFIYLLICTGARFSEINHLQYKDLQKNTIHLPGTKTETSNRTIDISESDMNHVKKLLSQRSISLHEPIFGLSYNAVEKTFNHAKKRLKIPEHKTLHSLRHTHCSFLLSQGVSIYYISQRLGHKNISITTQVYSHLLKEHYQEDNEKTLVLLGGM
ncbi:tyrosine-type recombinase/integrase [Salinicoccus albus]|uniref:tyrosine-type recombinase/integrase n=1 Tax=Salinicoccus albus TaxID=418756 RepID=UPI00035DAAB4|nr:site-specific integrase [Salinicoccus albus]